MFEQSLLGTAGRERGRRRWIAGGSVVVQVALAAGFVLLPLLYPAEMPSFTTAKLKTILFVKVKPPVVLRKPLVANSKATYEGAANAPSGTSVLAGIGRAGGGGAGGDGPLVTLKPGRISPLNVSRGVSAGMLLAPIQPVYPPIAKMSGVAGTVVVSATIDRSGRIVGVQVLSGPAMLQKAAADAVRDARYRPYLLNGEPVEVVTTFSVNFVMGAG